ncbi:isoeugenol monooxygenase [Colletotrichum truncatum]|uniref:Isoeugenol monooxygenase n=1 Tax=Colletotrichum truncatum TaxID=5467 RepID=A0ACC3ZBG4_COLTU|nr:isoeugenol monooxygenase [Colletotrichum truncatum]KAF6787785.1 isoeugenol monooxygenase [Colletotrichum truncatum]
MGSNSAEHDVIKNNVSTQANYGLKTKWPEAYDLAGSNLPCRLEGEIGDLVVLGEIPKEIDGTFYRVMTDPFVPPHPGNVPLDGDGHISAFRIKDGRVDMRMRYVETERYKLERKANKALFGLYRNPYTHHPCVRAAVDSTANTNLVLWADHLLALKEGGLPYSVDPHTLETIKYDPFGPQVRSKTFTAHPKVDPYTNELLVFGYEATGLASLDIVIFALDSQGVKHDEQWIKSPWCAPIHDCAITPNWIILVLWPFEANVERMKKGGHHWAWDYDLPATFVVIPRRSTTPLPPGWKPGEHRVYSWENCMLIHTGGAWESEDGSTLRIETTRVHDNGFPFFPTNDGRLPAPDPASDYVCWTLDLSQPNNSKVCDPEVILNLPSEFPRIDERFLTQSYNCVWINVHIDESQGANGHTLVHGLNGLAMHNKSSGKTEYFYAGSQSFVQEPIFIPRSDNAPEGDGWVMAMVERRGANRNEIVVLDTRSFGKPIAVIQLPFHVKAQVHGNWVDQRRLKSWKKLAREVEAGPISGLGALEPL